jgi:UPF0716 protein FxsA
MEQPSRLPGGWVEKSEIRNPKWAGGRDSSFLILDSMLYPSLMFFRLLVLFTVVPLVELYLLIRVGGVIGVLPTIAVVVVTGAVGAALARWQGLGVLRRFQHELSEGRAPTGTLIDGLLILLAAVLLLTPGLLTDLVGFLLLVPGGRALVRRAASVAVERRLGLKEPDVIDAQWRREE